jgi:hypothetical protein
MELVGLRTLAHAFWLTPASVWLFTTRDDVEPTNNLAERDLRGFVLRKRKTFFTQSWRGDRFVERVSTVVITCRKQQRNLFDFIIDSCAGRSSSRSARACCQRPEQRTAKPAYVGVGTARVLGGDAPATHYVRART